MALAVRSELIQTDSQIMGMYRALQTDSQRPVLLGNPLHLRGRWPAPFVAKANVRNVPLNICAMKQHKYVTLPHNNYLLDS